MRSAAATPPVTFALIPGAGGDAWYWHRLVPELEGLGHRAVAIELPAEDDTAGLADYAQVVVDALGDDDPVAIVAQSMGGLTAPLVCARRTVDLVVLVNAMIPLPGETGAEWWPATGQPAARERYAVAEGRTPPDGVDPMEDFLHDLPPAVLEEALRRGQPTQSGAPFADPHPLPSCPEVPTRVIAGRDDRFFPAAFQRQVAEQRLGIVPDEIPGGHLLALANPAGLAEQLHESWKADSDPRAEPVDLQVDHGDHR
jgi:pimeloyl-ACP methyl ester carboxylesterase